MSTPFYSAKDPVEFRPNSEALRRAREALDKAEKEAAACTQAGEPGGPDVTPHDLRDAVKKAGEAVDAAEKALAKEDPAFLLMVPNGRTQPLVVHAVNADPLAPIIREDGDILRMAREEIGDLTEAEAAVLTAHPDNAPLTHEVWSAVQMTRSGRAALANRVMYLSRLNRHSVRYHLIVEGLRTPIADERLDGLCGPYIPAIAAELGRLSTLSEDDAKN